MADRSSGSKDWLFALSSAGHPDNLTEKIMGHGKDKEREILERPSNTPSLTATLLTLKFSHFPPPHTYTFLYHFYIAMSFNKVNRTSTSSVTGPNHGSINGSRLVRDQKKPRATRYASLSIRP